VRTLERALHFFAELGCAPPEAVMTDNAMVYRESHRFRDLLAANQINHIRIPPYTPRWNGKVERFILTLETERAPAGGHGGSVRPVASACSQPTLISIAPTSRTAIAISRPISRIASVSRAVECSSRRATSNA